MARLGFGAFLAPHHPIGENPMLQFRRDIAFVQAPRRARLRRVLVRRASFVGLGDDRLARDVPGRGRRAHQAHQARDRRDLAALPQPVQRRAAHGPARLDDRRPRDLRLGPRRAAVRRLHARHRSDDPARPPGRGDRHHPPAVPRRAGHPEGRLVRPARCGPAAPAAAGGDAVRRRLADQPVGHDARRQVRHRHHLARLDVERGPDGAADPVGLRRDGREEARHDGRPQELARAAQLAHRRDPREGARGGQARPDALAQRIHPRHAAAAGLDRLHLARPGGRRDGRRRARPPSSARRTTS